MSQPVHEYITERVGQVWTVEDAAFVADKIRQIEQVAEQVVRLNQNPAGTARFATAIESGERGW